MPEGDDEFSRTEGKVIADRWVGEIGVAFFLRNTHGIGRERPRSVHQAPRCAIGADANIVIDVRGLAGLRVRVRDHEATASTIREKLG